MKTHHSDYKREINGLTFVPCNVNRKAEEINIHIFNTGGKIYKYNEGEYVLEAVDTYENGLLCRVKRIKNIEPCGLINYK